MTRFYGLGVCVLGMTLKQYANLIDKILFCEYAWVCVDTTHVRVFAEQPKLVKRGRNGWEWVGQAGAYPLMVIRYEEGDLNLEEFRARDGEIDWSMARTRV
jgi:hypothetical protein